MGLRFVPFTKALAGARGVEIAQTRVTQTVSAFVPTERALEGQLSLSVRIGRSVRIAFFNRLFVRLAIGRRRGREHDLEHTTITHRLKQVQSSDDVIVILLRR